MAFIPTPGVVRCALRYNLFSEDVVNTLWFAVDGQSIDVNTMTDLATYLANTWFVTHIAPAVSLSLTLEDITVTDQSSETAPSVPVSFTSVAGDLAGGTMPGSVCITVSFRTPNRGRSARGRNYISGLMEDSVNQNQLDSATLTQLRNGYDDLRVNPPPGWLWGVVSKQKDNAPRAEGLFQLITDVVIVDSNIDSQRRRLTGRGS